MAKAWEIAPRCSSRLDKIEPKQTPAVSSNPMRLEGTLKTWKDERGFGFIEPTQGGQEIFVHAQAFRERIRYPQVGQLVSFEVELGPQGKKRAKNVEFIQPTRSPSPTPQRRKSLTRPSTAALWAMPIFLILYIFVSILWKPPLIVAVAYVGASLVTFFAYAIDKSAARNGTWRTPESTLHFLALAGGWPGALLAQHLLRHKSSKADFILVFWGTVFVNIAAFVILCSPVVKFL